MAPMLANREVHLTRLGRRRRWLLLLPLAAVVLMLTSCSHDPTSYTDSVKNNFINACHDQGPSRQVCTCTFRQIKANIAFKDFKSVQDRLRDKPRPLNDVKISGRPVGRRMASYRQQCEQKASGGSPGSTTTTKRSSSSSTTAGSTTSGATTSSG